MGRVELTGLLLISAGCILYVLSGSPAKKASSTLDTQPPQAPVKKAVTQPRVVKAAVRVASAPKPAQFVQVKPKKVEPAVNARYVQMNGIIGESERWASSVFGNAYWTMLAPNQYEHTNGSQLTLTSVDGRVRQIRMDFGAGLMSPHMQTVLDYALGRGTNAPLYLDTIESATDELSGTFTHKNKHELRYRAGREQLKDLRRAKTWLVIELAE